ncbi:MAG TPA: hypothetical protein VMI13_02625 [Solirubrobacteraceae bacterium]|nr:hypothetical protein [Solirubrobacteraceae bacterium]
MPPPWRILELDLELGELVAASTGHGCHVELVQERHLSLVPDVRAQREQGDGDRRLAGEEGDHVRARAGPAVVR